MGNLSAFSERVGKILACSFFLFFFGEDTAKNYLVTHPWFLDVWDFPRSALRPLGVSASMPGLSIWRKTSWGLFRNRPDRRMDAKKVQRLPTEMASKPPPPHSPGRGGLRGVVPNRVTVREVREREVHSRLWGGRQGGGGSLNQSQLERSARKSKQQHPSPGATSSIAPAAGTAQRVVCRSTIDCFSAARFIGLAAPPSATIAPKPPTTRQLPIFQLVL